MTRRLLTLGAVLIVALISGCRAPSYNVEVYLSPSFKEEMKVYPSLEIDIVGVNENEAERFDSCMVNDYFQGDNALRKSADHYTMFFSENDITYKKLGKHDDIWKKFGRKDSTKLYLLVNLPASAKNSKSAKDARKISIPLESAGLFGTSKRYFEINPAGITQLKDRPKLHVQKESTSEAK